ncbi:MAG: hypothetical protein DSY58_00095 [Desulfobulbus sp.]|nr:MAG: hypothetical protein DSY58_00095 [Desulfobulbus sp.]
MIRESQHMMNEDGFFQAFFDQSPCAMQILRANGTVLKINKAWEEFWEQSSVADISNYNINSDIKAQALGMTSAFKQALAGITASLRNMKYTLDADTAGTGGVRFLNVRMLPLVREGKGVEGVVCILEDNSKNRFVELEKEKHQNRLKEEITRRTKQFESLLQFSAEILTINDPTEVFEFVTSWAQSLFGLDYSSLLLLEKNGKLLLKEVIGFSRSLIDTFELQMGEGLAGLVAQTQQVDVTENFATETRFTIPDIIGENGITSALAAPMLNKDGLTGVLVGHTKSKRIFSQSERLLYQSIANQAAVAVDNAISQQSLKRSEKRFRHLFESANDAIYLIDLESDRIVDCNRKALELGGYSREELAGMDKYALYPSGEHAVLDERYKKILLKESLPAVSSHSYIHKDGSHIPVEISTSLVETGGQKLMMNIVRDVSRRKALEEEREETSLRLRRASRMEAIGLMAGGVAHDLNNILSGIISYPELMMLKFPSDSPVQEDLKKVIASGQRAAGVVADLLTVARGAATVKEIACLNELIKSYLVSPEFCKLASLYPQVNFLPSLTPGIATILCSSGHVQKMLMNLVTNAAEAVEGKGEVKVSTSSYVVSEKESSLDLLPGKYTVLEVSDTGTGISRYDLEHIFDPFYTTKKMGRSGTGLGLAVVWNTVQDHDGLVRVKSDDRGTSFVIYLPISPETHTCKMTPGKSSLEELHGKGNLLVVDDEKSQRDIAVKILSVLGYKASAVSSGEEAIAFIKKKQPDLLLLDMLMDPGLNGRQTFERIIRLYPDQKAIVVSGYSDSEDINKLMEMGVLGLLKKPYTMEKMGLVVKEALQ